MTDLFFAMAISYKCHGALVGIDESTKRVNESSRRINEPVVEINECGGKNVENEQIL
jgi:hypothetical protein